MKGIKQYQKLTGLAAFALAFLLLSGCWVDKSKRNYEFAPNMFHSIPLEPYSQTTSDENPEAKVKFSPQGQPDNRPSGISAFYAPDGTIPREESWYHPEAYLPYEMPNNTEGYERSDTEVVSPLEDPNPESGYNCDESSYAKGKELYEIFCAVCHGTNGDGNGILPASGKFAAVPSYKSAEGVGLKNLSAGKMYHSITYGKGVMGSYASQLSPRERWQVICYVQEFQKAGE
jgi:mono/diheme cytochrome c family protein